MMVSVALILERPPSKRVLDWNAERERNTINLCRAICKTNSTSREAQITHRGKEIGICMV